MQGEAGYMCMLIRQNCICCYLRW